MRPRAAPEDGLYLRLRPSRTHAARAARSAARQPWPDAPGRSGNRSVPGSRRTSAGLCSVQLRPTEFATATVERAPGPPESRAAVASITEAVTQTAPYPQISIAQP